MRSASNKSWQILIQIWKNRNSSMTRTTNFIQSTVRFAEHTIQKKTKTQRTDRYH